MPYDTVSNKDLSMGATETQVLEMLVITINFDHLQFYYKKKSYKKTNL